MDRSTYLQYIKNILLDFDHFKFIVDECCFDEISVYFPDGVFQKENYEKSIIFLLHTLLQKYTAPELLDICNEFIAYLSFLKEIFLYKPLKYKINLTLSLFQADFVKIPEKLVVIEAKRFLNILNQFSDFLTEENIKHLCSNFPLDKSQYDYFIGYDFYATEFEQLSFFLEEKTDLDVSIGERRTKSKRKMNADLSKKEIQSDSKIDEAIPLIKTYLSESSFTYLEHEIQVAKSKQKKTMPSDDGYAYFYHMT